MHSSFSGLFVHPRSFKPLIYFGDVEGGDGIPLFVLSPHQTWSEEIIRELEKAQEEKWVKREWTNGFLWAYDEPEMYPVIEGIPVFVPPPEQTWPPLAAKELREGRWIEGNWERAGEMLKEKSKLTEFAERMAKSEGLILDLASGPGGGFAPKILRVNPGAAILMDDLGLPVLREWQRFLRNRGTPNVSFALFDARRMPLKSDSIDMVSGIGGFSEIRRSPEAVKEAHRVLKTGGTLFSYDSTAEKEDLLRLPEEVGKKWYNLNPPFWDGFLEIFKRVGFKVVSHTLLNERELSPNEGDLPREADRYGVKLHVKGYCTEAKK